MADKLKIAQKTFILNIFYFLVFDAYRPQKTVNHLFVGQKLKDTFNKKNFLKQKIKF